MPRGNEACAPQLLKPACSRDCSPSGVHILITDRNKAANEMSAPGANSGQTNTPGEKCQVCWDMPQKDLLGLWKPAEEQLINVSTLSHPGEPCRAAGI